MMVRFLTVFFLFVVVGCSSNPVERVYLNKNLEYSLPINPWSGSPLSAFQQVTVSYGKELAHFQAIVDVNQDLATIVMLDLAGRRTIDIEWSTQGIAIKTADWLPENVKAAEILARLVLAFWPIEDARKGLPQNSTLHQTGFVRSVEQASQTVVRMSRDGDNPWTSKTIIDHGKSGFQIIISSSLRGAQTS